MQLCHACLLPAELDGGKVNSEGVSIHSMTTGEWQQAYEADGYVDLWVEEEFNSGSRLVVRPCTQHSTTKIHVASQNLRLNPALRYCLLPVSMPLHKGKNAHVPAWEGCSAEGGCE